MAKFGLSLNEEKTRILQFGWCAAERRTRRATPPGNIRVPWVHAHLRRDPNQSALHNPGPDNRLPYGGDARGDTT